MGLPLKDVLANAIYHAQYLLLQPVRTS